MSKQTTVLILIIYLLTNVAFAQSPGKYKSKEIYDFSLQIGKSAKNKIWNEFDFRNYTRQKNDSEGGYVSFSTAPGEQGDQTFAWKVIDDYFLNHTVEEDLSITFHEAFHAFQRDQKRAGAKWGAENSLLIFEYQESSARNNALFTLDIKDFAIGFALQK